MEGLCLLVCLKQSGRHFKNMKESNISFSRFCDSFSDSYKNNFSYEGKKALFDYLEEYEAETGEEIELDTVALCCEYSEFEDLKDLQGAYPDITSLDDLRNHTEVIEIEGSERFIIRQY
jgi:hypothetical protein